MQMSLHIRLRSSRGDMQNALHVKEIGAGVSVGKMGKHGDIQPLFSLPVRLGSANQ